MNNVGGQLFATVNNTPVTSGASFIEGTEIFFTAQLAEGYNVKTWNVDGEDVSAFVDVTYMLTQNANVTIEFTKKKYTLTYDIVDNNGSVTGVTSQDVLYGDSGTPVLAVANPGFHFVQWCDGVTDNPRTDANVTNNLIVNPEFAVSSDIQTTASSTVEVYPNPFVNELHINNAADIVKYSLINSAGQIELLGVNNGADAIVIPVQGVQSGMVVLMIQTTDGKQTYHKLMKK